MSDPQRPREQVSSDPLLLTPEEAAEVLHVGRTTVYALMKAGELRAVHIGRSCRLSRSELERYVRGLEAPRTTPRAPRRTRTSTDSSSSARRRPMPRESTGRLSASERAARLNLQHMTQG